MGRRILNDTLRTIVNAEKRGKATVQLQPVSNVMSAFLRVMKNRGFIHKILQVKSSRALELECLPISIVVLGWCCKIWDSLPCEEQGEMADEAEPFMGSGRFGYVHLQVKAAGDNTVNVLFLQVLPRFLRSQC